MNSIKHRHNDKYPSTVLVREFSGKVSADDIIESWELLYNQNLFTKEILGVLNDLGDCELNMTIEEFQQIMKYMNQQAHFKKLKLAVVTNSPQQIIFPSIGEMKEHELNIRPFSTIEAAINWITM